MNQRQKSIICNFVFVVVATTIFVVAMINVKDLVNKSEAMRAMDLLGQDILQYREKFKSLPPESYVKSKIDFLKIVRLGDLKYRARWIGFEAEPDTILAYSLKDYSFLVKKGYVVLRLDGRVEWMAKPEFRKLLNEQQTQVEIELLQNTKF